MSNAHLSELSFDLTEYYNKLYQCSAGYSSSSTPLLLALAVHTIRDRLRLSVFVPALLHLHLWTALSPISLGHTLLQCLPLGVDTFCWKLVSGMMNGLLFHRPTTWLKYYTGMYWMVSHDSLLNSLPYKALLARSTRQSRNLLTILITLYELKCPHQCTLQMGCHMYL